MEKSKVKNSIILSGLIGTGGFFFAKLISLLYVIPLSTILGSVTYTGYYGTAYRIYSYFLNVFSAGFPFAIATLVAKYTALEDSKTVLIIKKLSIAFLALAGFVGMIVMMVLSGVLAPIMSNTTNPENIKIMQTILCILGVAVFLVPILSAYRGFIQGRKEIGEYAFSQTFEQIFRVGFLLSVSCLLVYGFGLERKWALYASVTSTVIAAIAGLIQIFVFDKKSSKDIAINAQKQESDALPIKKLFKEFIMLAIPYLLVAIFGYSDDIFNSILLPIGLEKGSYTVHEIDTIKSAMNYAGTKLTAIPMILAPGFTAAIIPHISAALVEGNIKLIRKNVTDCINIIFYLGLSISFCLFVFAEPLTYTLFAPDDLQLSANVLRWLSVEAFIGTLLPVVTNLMMALKLRKNVLKRLVIYTIIKGVLMIPLMMIMGYAGAIVSSFIGAVYLLSFNMADIQKEYHISLKNILHKLCFISVGLASLWLTSVLLTKVGLGGCDCSRMVCFVKMAGNGILSVLVFLAVTFMLQIPQSIFHFNMSDIRQKLNK